jgi:hypothetical protein
VRGGEEEEVGECFCAGGAAAAEAAIPETHAVRRRRDEGGEQIVGERRGAA